MQGHPRFDDISDLFDKFCRKQARQRKKEILHNSSTGKNGIVTTESMLPPNTVIVDYFEEV